MVAKEEEEITICVGFGHVARCPLCVARSREAGWPTLDTVPQAAIRESGVIIFHSFAKFVGRIEVSGKP
jgi:hypothetical protein